MIEECWEPALSLNIDFFCVALYPYKENKNFQKQYIKKDL